jgi:hypothetical protein
VDGAEFPSVVSEDPRPPVFILSDSLGETAEQVTRAALSQFDDGTFHVVRLPKIETTSQVRAVVEHGCKGRCVFFYTFADPALRAEVLRLTSGTEIEAIDIMGPGIEALSAAAGQPPSWQSGLIRLTDGGYFERMEALEFAVDHDDGRRFEDLLEAEIVLVGVSRTSKTPLAMYLAFQGHRVANVPLALGTEPPAELFQVDPKRIFGLISDPEVLVGIRTQRIAEMGAPSRHYADMEYVCADLEAARRLMRKLGCIVIKVTDRAIEETAREIIRYTQQAFPRGS